MSLLHFGAAIVSWNLAERHHVKQLSRLHADCFLGDRLAARTVSSLSPKPPLIQWARQSNNTTREALSASSE